LRSLQSRLGASLLLAASLGLLALAEAKAGDATRGEEIAKRSCAACHFVESLMIRQEVADAPPFVTIAQQYNFDADMLVFKLLESHPKMNFALTRRDANDVAAYMSTLGR
jgi:mono/diheme cytochrome c family protein